MERGRGKGEGLKSVPRIKRDKGRSRGAGEMRKEVKGKGENGKRKGEGGRGKGDWTGHRKHERHLYMLSLIL
jgi:hypothetical protein